MGVSVTFLIRIPELGRPLRFSLVIFRNRIFAVLALPVLGATFSGVAACGNSSSDASGSSSAASSAAAPSGELTFETVKSLTAQRFNSDPNCVSGQWSPNSTGIDDPYRVSAKTIQQYDCYKTKEVKGMPDRFQQSIYVEFGDERTASDFVNSQTGLYNALVAGTKVVVAGSGLESVDMKAYLTDLKSACGCGEVLEAHA
jgi:hypothetical protein